MPASGFDVSELLQQDPERWDRRIAADLAEEVMTLVGENHIDIPEMRRFLAVKGYRDLKSSEAMCERSWRRGRATSAHSWYEAVCA